MYNWSTSTTLLKKNPEKFAIWKLEQMINFGLGKDKIDTKLLKKYWEKINIDPEKRRVLSFWLWQKQS